MVMPSSMHKTTNLPRPLMTAVIKKEQDKAAPAKPVTTSRVNKRQRKYNQLSPYQKKRHQVREGNITG
eukprot:133330-Ditylum_brightwellii.AAC.1